MRVGPTSAGALTTAIPARYSSAQSVDNVGDDRYDRHQHLMIGTRPDPETTRDSPRQGASRGPPPVTDRWPWRGDERRSAVPCPIMTTDADRIVSLVDGRVDLPTRRVVRHGTTATLTTLEARLLGYLTARPGEIVSRQRLLEEVWDYNPSVETRAIDQAVWRLRTKIERDAREPRHLLTAHGRGYVFEPAGEPPAAPSAAPAAADADASAPDDRRRDDSAFVGREDELRRLGDAFEGAARLVVLTGPGGVGKTRLAMELGFRWPGRVVLCDLSNAATEAALVEGVARALDVVLTSDMKPGAAAGVLGRALADLGPGLVVFDDLDRGVARFPHLVRRWLADAPDVRYLVTTRRDLPLDELAGALELPLEGLSQGAGVSLFQARAREALRRRAAEFDAGAVEIGHLVSHIGAMPLAIEVAAARAGSMSIREMVARLDDSVVVAGEAATRARPAAVQGTLSWSWDLLDEDERRAFAQLSVFRGGADLEAAEAVIELGPGGGRVADALARLAAASLVKLRAQECGLPRYALLESVGDFAAEKLDDDARASLADRHRAYFLGASGRAGAAFRGRGGVAALAWLVREQANVLEACRRAREEHPQAAAALALAVEPLLAVQGPYERQGEVLDLAVAAAAAGGAEALLAEALLRRSGARRVAGARADGRADLAEAKRIADGLGELTLLARAAVLEGQFRRHDAPAAEALAAFDAALAIAEAAGAPLVIADARRERGTLYLEQHAFAAARADYEAALAAYRAVGDEAATAWTLTRLATVMLELGAHAAAEATFREALAAHDAVGDRRGRAVVVSNLAVLEHEEGRLDRAESHWRVATAIHRTLGAARFVGFGLAGLGLIAIERGDGEGAVALLEEALDVFQVAGDAFFEGVTNARLGVVLGVLGREEDAEAAFARARARLATSGPWAARALALHEGLAAALRAPAEASPAAPDPSPTETSFERSARRLWERRSGGPPPLA